MRPMQLHLQSDPRAQLPLLSHYDVSSLCTEKRTVYLSDQIARMRGIIWSYAVHIQQKDQFCTTRFKGNLSLLFEQSMITYYSCIVDLEHGFAAKMADKPIYEKNMMLSTHIIGLNLTPKSPGVTLYVVYWSIGRYSILKGRLEDLRI